MDDRQPHTGDEGFSLIEVVVALGMLAVVSSAALAMFLGGLSDSSQLERRQSAVALTSAAVEGARSVSAVMQTQTANGTTSTFSGLVRGRASADVTAQWAASAAPGTSQTLPMWDPSVTSSTAAVVPLRSPTTVAGQAYTTSVLIGTCYRPRANTAAECDTAGLTARPATPPLGTVEMVRVIATTSWGTVGRGGCSASSPCSYTTSVLVDPSTDPVWSTQTGDVVDDAFSLRQGTTTDVAVLANDLVNPAAANPVSLVSGPSGVSGATTRTLRNGAVRVALPAGSAPGLLEFQYVVRNSAGGTTSAATVRVTVTP